MATISVVNIEPDNGLVELEKAEKSENASTMSSNSDENAPTKAEKTRKRGRPAGAKDLKRRKTPVKRRKTAPTENPAAVVEEVRPPPAQEVPQQSQAPPAQEVMQAPPAQEAKPVPQPSAPPMTNFQRLHLQLLERKNAESAHWDDIVSRMVRLPIF